MIIGSCYVCNANVIQRNLTPPNVEISTFFSYFDPSLTECTLSALVRPGCGEKALPLREDSGLTLNCLESLLPLGDSALGTNLTTRPSASSNTKQSLSTYSLS